MVNERRYFAPLANGQAARDASPTRFQASQGGGNGRIDVLVDYDDLHRVVGRTDDNGKRTEYVYDPLDRTTEIRCADNTQETYAEDVFKNAVPNDPTSPTAWFGRNSDGQIYRYSLGGDGTAHFSGIHGVGDGTRSITRYALDRLDGL